MAAVPAFNRTTGVTAEQLEFYVSDGSKVGAVI